MKARTFLITGAAGGIGGAVADELAARGARLVLLGRKAAALEARAARLGGQGAQVRTLVADLREGTPADVARRAVGLFGSLDGIINCAGVQQFGEAADETAASTEETFLINVVVPIQLIQALLPHLRERPRAHVVNVGSIFGSIGFPCFATYSASKFALRGYSEALRRELAGSPVRVHYVAPRFTRTPFNSEAVRRMSEVLGMNQDTPEEVARRLADAIAGDVADLYLGWPEAFFVRLNALLPRLVDPALIRQGRQMLPFARRKLAP